MCLLSQRLISQILLTVFRNDENEKNITNLSKSNRKYELTENFYSIGFTSIT